MVGDGLVWTQTRGWRFEELQSIFIIFVVVILIFIFLSSFLFFYLFLFRIILFLTFFLTFIFLHLFHSLLFFLFFPHHCLLLLPPFPHFHQHYPGLLQEEDQVSRHRHLPTVQKTTFQTRSSAPSTLFILSPNLFFKLTSNFIFRLDFKFIYLEYHFLMIISKN